MNLPTVYINFTNFTGTRPVQPEDLAKIFDWCPMTQREIATHVESVIGRSVDQSSISRYLRGLSYPNHTFIKYLGRVLPNGMVGPDAFLTIDTGIELKIPQAIQTGYVGQYVAVDSSAQDSPPEAEVIEEKKAEVMPTKFPIAEAYAVASMARKAQVNEGKNFTFSTRKMILWGQVYTLLRESGYDYQPALAGGYHLAVLDKQIGDDKKILRDFFQAKLGFDANMPKPLTQDNMSHPMQYFLEMCIRAGIPIWTHGPTGCGKTFSAERICERLYPVGPERTRSYIRFQGSIDKTVDDLVGGYGAKDGNTIREYGPLALCMQEGIPFIYDEPTAVTAEVAFEFQAVLEGNPLIISKFRGEAIHPEPGFTIIACDNTIGQGEANEYVGTNMMNEAFRDRFLFMEYDFMPPDIEKNVVTYQIDNFHKSLCMGTTFVDTFEPEEVTPVTAESTKKPGMTPDEIIELLESIGGAEEDD